ncbi:MAG: DMT family transporter [Hyphomicrobiaceae bacterium]
MSMIRLTAKLTALPGNVRGVLWGISAALFFSIMLTLIKMLGQTAQVAQILFIRQSVMFIVALPLIAAEFPNSLLSQRVGLHLIRVGFATCSMVASFLAVIHLPLADATALGFSRALFTTLFAILFLKEIVGGRRWMAILFGFIGVLVMLRPSGGSGFDLYALLAVIGAASAAVVGILIRVLSRTERPVTILTYQAVCVGIIVAPFAACSWVPLSPLQWLMAIGVGLAASAGQMSNIRSYRAGQASVVAPLDYTKLIWTTLLGYALFAVLPGQHTLIGAAIIVVASLYVLLQELRSASKPRANTRDG